MSGSAFRGLLFAFLLALFFASSSGAVMPDDLVGAREYVPGPEAKGPWPALIGKTSEEAKRYLESSFPDLKVIVVKDGSMMTMDYRIDRVRIMVNDEGIVTKAPHRG